MSTYRRKLIEVALPLDAINKASAREKSIRHGHPSTLHLWWSRKPLAACRAVLWASLVDDPSAHPERFPTEEAQNAERKRLFGILEGLVIWENSNNPEVLAEAKAEVERCFPDGPPAVLDPFAGGGSIPLEAQRLGLTALAGELNPVAVLINKAMLEFPTRFAGRAPVHPEARSDSSTGSGEQGRRSGRSEGAEEARSDLSTWSGAQGLAADIRAYGAWMRDEAQRRIGHLYPDAVGPDGGKLTPIAWIWAKTVRSPDPAWDGHVPLLSSWTLRKARGKPEVWVEPIVDKAAQSISYRVRVGGAPTLERTVKRGNGVCVATGAAIPVDYIRTEGQAGRMGAHLLAVVAEGNRRRQYCEPSAADIDACRAAAELAETGMKPAGKLPPRGQGLRFNVQNYGYEEWWQLFTDRQLLALTTFSDLLSEVREQVLDCARYAGLVDDGVRLRDGGAGGAAYADVVVTYLAFVVDKCADYWSNVSTWVNSREIIGHTFAMPGISMSWDFAEANPFSSSTGNWLGQLEWVCKAFEHFPAAGDAEVEQKDARVMTQESVECLISTDPPNYDKIGYADISDFFYVWLRRNLADVWPDECATLLSPKVDELIADSSRHGGRKEAQAHFESGMAEFMAAVAASQHPDVPATIYCVYNATGTSKEGRVRSTGWEALLQAVIDAGLQVTASWPLRTERSARLSSIGANALASSVVLVCRPRLASAPLATRSEFIAALRGELPQAIKVLQSGNIAPVDLPQSTIGPGISVFSRYARVVEADGRQMPVRETLAVVNQVLDEVLHEEESELDAETRFALAWYTQHGFEAGPFGEAESVARAKNTAVEGVIKAGIGEVAAGKFRLYARSELDLDWEPSSGTRLTAWEALQHLAARLGRSESQAADLLRRLGGVADRARQLAYLLHKIASDNRWAEEALTYNNLIAAWPILRSRPQLTLNEHL